MPSRQSALLALATLSGAVALLYEVVFFRALGLAFGVSVHAVAAVVAAFLGGLGAGAALGGRFLDRGDPIRIYALLELGIAAYGYVAPFLFRTVTGWVANGDLPELFLGPLPAGTFAAAFLLLLLPTALMGATFPVLGRAIAGGASDVTKPVGLLYGLNTLGAFAGVFCGAFWVLPTFGMTGSAHLAAGCNLVLAIIALLIASRAGTRPAAEADAIGSVTPTQTPPDLQVVPADRRALLVAVAGVGFASIALQVLGNRLLVTLLGGSVYTFAAVLSTFLIGIGVGGAVGGGWIARSKRPMTSLACGAITITGAIGAGLLLLRWKVGPEDPLFGAINLDLALSPDAGIWPYARASFTLGLLAFLPATLISGAFLPAVTRFIGSDPKRLSRGLGQVYGLNTAGSIAGSIVAGFFLLPVLELRTSLVIAAVTAILFAGLPLLLAARRRREAGAVKLAGVAVIASAALLYAGLRPGPPPGSTGEFQYTSIFHEESEASAVHVVEFADGNEPLPVRSLAVNGKVVASSLFVDRRLQLLLGFIPTLIHENPQKILSIALGTGMSSGALAVSGAESVEIVELSRGVIDACPLFDAWNAKVDRRRNVTIHQGDGRRFLTRSDDRYDLISADPIHPWVAGSAYLYTVEYYEIAREHLNDGGIMTQWIPLYQLSTEDIAGIARSFTDAFEHASAWVTGYDMVLVGSKEPLTIDVGRIERRLQSQPTRGMLADIGVTQAADILGLYFAGRESLVALGQQARGPITDDRPWIEFSAPRSLFALYANEIFRHLANSGDELPLPEDGLSAGVAEEIQRASALFRTQALRFIQDMEGGIKISDARARYSDDLRRGSG